MRTISTRRLTIFDMTMLVAATAVGLTVLRAFWNSGWVFRQFSLGSHIRFMAQCVNEACFPFLASWTVCFLILRLRQPRPTLRRLARQPGMAACSAAALVLVVPLMAIVIPEIYGALRTINYKAALLQAFGLGSTPPTPVGPYGSPMPTLPKVAQNNPQTQSPIAGTINAGLGQPPAPLAVPTASFPSLAMVRGPDLYEPHQPLWLWYSLRAINLKIVPGAHRLGHRRGVADASARELLTARAILDRPIRHSPGSCLDHHQFGSPRHRVFHTLDAPHERLAGTTARRSPSVPGFPLDPPHPPGVRGLFSGLGGPLSQ